MKLTIHENPHVKENEAILICTKLDHHMKCLANYIQNYDYYIKGYNGSEYTMISLKEILYFDSTDGSTFLYSKDKIYEIKNSLKNLEQELPQTNFIRISKNCILNLDYLKQVVPYPNHRMLATLKSNEQLIISRQYIATLKIKLRTMTKEVI
ncbi:LytTR family DNA-binding domain-containing protein [Anaerocolumna sp. MB42-C2]|uniref:LytTR family DNA-binding domain-containing protein n=1 Tax=Anaerocolumna sp. MB42-C2 TaxID=3070997 RepID=UPI0027DFF848|nr:LytTR family DNA-binding domain-containing protein [Anaerocolumna sp. MB42-C2]WMJ88012.1 LytTR family DNA-binding domain-containing protein [Anaerocolumna sp. MB42-C2]